ncbi:MAG: ATP-binding protein [Clostridia bacterium]|nr:ATP-binding protein [Clostridia bacterium]
MRTLKVYNSLISSNINNVGSTVSDILFYLREAYNEIGEDCLFELRVILNELILNAVRHGNKEESNKQVKISVGVTGNEYMFLIIEDQGEGYNYKCIVEENQNINELFDICNMKETGRGVMIVRTLCDRLKFNKKGNKVVVLKKFCKI